MKQKDVKPEKNKQGKNESDLVTRESLCAVGALFSVLAFFILCTRTLIFGDLGYAVYTFLTGVFGYLAYPLLLLTLYVCVTALLEKRFVKNRKACLCVALCLFCVALIVQMALTWSWLGEAEYAKRCYYMSEDYPNATLLGWIGGIIISACASVTSSVGAIILFSVLTLIFGYLTFVCVKKGTSASTDAKGKTTKKDAKNHGIAPVEIQAYAPSAPQEQPVQPVAMQTQNYESAPVQPYAQHPVAPTPVSTPMYERKQGSYATESAFGVQPQQRPTFNLQENNKTAESASTSMAFSPFGTPQTVRTDLQDEQPQGREFLFGATPAENYQKNLIFDPNARVNRRPAVEPSEQPILQSGYTPSYTDDYQKSVNENTDDISPVKIVRDQVDEYSTRSYDEEPQNDNPYGLNIPRMQPVEQPPVLPQEPVSYPEYTQEDSGAMRGYEERTEEPFIEEDSAPTFERRDESTDRRGDWNDYKGLFSPENPNVFGNRSEDRSLAEDTFSRSRGDRNEEDFTANRGRDNGVLDDIFGDARAHEQTFESDRDSARLGRDFFDDKEETDDPYALKDDFSSDRSSAFETVSRRSEDRFEETLPPVVEPEIKVEKPVIKPKVEQAPPPPKPRIIRPYVRVPLDDFDCRDIEPTTNFDEMEETKENIIATLEEFNVNGATIASVTNGPTVTRYNVTLPRSIPPKKVVALDQSIALSLHSSGINIYPNYEDGVVSIEVPNKERQFVQLGCMLAGDTFVNSKPSSLMFAMGKDVGNRKVYGDISKMIHLLVAGSSGSGKSVFLGSLIVSMIYKYSPEELRLILIDPKKTEFVLYNNLPHLMINEIITDVNKAVQSLNWAIGEMNRRYGLFELMSRAGTYVVNLDDYNANVQKKEDKLPKIVIIIDELADLMLAAKKEIEDRIQNLTQKARAAGIHLIVATQRPSTDVITGVIKSNLSTRIAFAVATDVDSRVILDQSGAQNLLGKGDFLYTMQGINTPVRVQSAFISPTDSQRVVNFIKANNEAYYDEAATAFINNSKGDSGDGFGGGSGDEVEGVYIEALRFVILSGSASISMIQRKCSVGYNKAGKIVEWMEDMGYISSFDGAKARKVLITKEEFESKYGEL